MQRIEAGPDSVVIWLSGEPVPDRLSIPCLVRKILIRQGLEPWPEVEAECYSGGVDTLILARPVPPHPVGFFFENLEELLSATRTCPAAESSLYRLEDGYLLTVLPEDSPLSFYEHGRSVPLSPLWEFHGKDQGMCLMEGSAIGELKRFFSTSGL